MLQNNYDINLVESYLNAHPNPKNKDLYIFCNATTNSQKQCVRRKKLKLQKNIKPPDNNSKVEKLSSEDLERRLINALDNQPNNANLLGKAIDFFIKIKSKTDALEDDIDMEVLKQIGISATISK